MSLRIKIASYFVLEAWDRETMDIVCTVRVDKRPEFHKAPWTVLEGSGMDGTSDIISAHATRKQAIAEAKAYLAAVADEASGAALC
jgi:hypothetical protein